MSDSLRRGCCSAAQTERYCDPRDLIEVLQQHSSTSATLFWELVQVDLDHRWRREVRGIVQGLPARPLIEDYVELLRNDSSEFSRSLLTLVEKEGVPASVLESEFHARLAVGEPLEIKKGWHIAENPRPICAAQKDATLGHRNVLATGK